MVQSLQIIYGPVSGPMLQEEAKLTAERLGDNEFQDSNGWLEKWKKRYNFKEMRVAGEDGAVNEVTLDSWQERVKELTKVYAPENDRNMDETGQFWKALPDKSLSEAGKRCRGGKKAKQRCTWAFFVHAAGGKEEPVVIGKSKKPCCFKHLKDKTKPYKCCYFSNSKAWMRTEIMVNVLTKLIGRLKREGSTIILFLDNVPCHPHELKGQFSNITLWPFCRKIQHRRLSLLMPELLNCGRLRLEERCFALYVAKWVKKSQVRL